MVVRWQPGRERENTALQGVPRQPHDNLEHAGLLRKELIMDSPQGATITNAYVQFAADEKQSDE
jgi:hypothetical protein